MQVRLVESDADRQAFVRLVREYSAWLGVDLCFQHIDQELADLACYSHPAGCMLIASLPAASGDPAMVDDIGIVAVRPLAVKGDGYSLPPDAHEPACEMKRLYVKPGHQGLGIGKALVQEALANARALGYRFIALDTLERLAAANAMYEKAGFTRIPRYYASLPDAVFWGRPL